MDANLPDEMKFRSPRGKRPLPQLSRQQCKLKDVSSMRLLPPGTFSDYLKLLNCELPADGQVTMKTFSSAPLIMNFSKVVVQFSSKDGSTVVWQTFPSKPPIMSLGVGRIVCSPPGHSPGFAACHVQHLFEAQDDHQKIV